MLPNRMLIYLARTLCGVTMLPGVLALAACATDSLAPPLPTGAVEGYVCDPTRDTLAANVAVSGSGLPGRPQPTTTTDAGGFFVLTKLRVGPQQLSVTHNPASSSPTTTQLAVTVVANQRVSVPDPPCLRRRTGSITGWICAPTDATRVTPPVPGDAPAGAELPQDAPESDSDSESDTEDGGATVGTDTTSRGLGQATVSLTHSGNIYTTTTASDGTFVLRDVPIGEHQLQVRKGAFQAAIDVAVSESQTSNVERLCVEPRAQLGVITGRYDQVEQVLASLGFNTGACWPSTLSRASCSGLDTADHGTPGASPSESSGGPVTLIDGTSTYFLTDVLANPIGIDTFGALFLNCGLADQFIASAPPAVFENLRDFVAAGGSLYVSDWAYEMLRVAFPGAFSFAGGQDLPTQARKGSRNPDLAATIVDTSLANRLGSPQVALHYNKGDWVWLASQQPPEVQVWVQDAATSRPLLVSRPYGQGRLVFTSFHTHQQASQAMQDILRYIIFEL